MRSVITSPGWMLFVAMLVAVQAALVPASARAQEAPPADGELSAAEVQRADAHYAEAVRLFGQGRYREAVDAFDKAIAIRADAVYFCNRAVALIKLREWDEALGSMRTCRQWFRGPKAELAQVDAQLGGLAAFVDHVRPSALAVARDIATAPPPATALTGQPGLVAAQPAESSGLQTAGWVSLSIGGALLASALTLDWLSADLRDDFVAASSGDSRSEYNELKNELDTRQQLFYGLTISGGLLAATGVSLLGYHWLAEDEGPTSSHFVLTPHTSGALLHLKGNF